MLTFLILLVLQGNLWLAQPEKVTGDKEAQVQAWVQDLMPEWPGIPEEIPVGKKSLKDFRSIHRRQYNDSNFYASNSILLPEIAFPPAEKVPLYLRLRRLKIAAPLA